uniref:non-specific serine/threonine protein kinase n=1 Tax=Schizophyllum commune (strain H4-8 / FGSC 9210) TaxID=578458 RepID=D8Q6L8_SCHCM
MMAETLCGSPLYMAPEILRSEKYDAKADLWSVGAVLYEMAVGRPPFRAQNHIELLNKIEKGRGVRFADEENGATPSPNPPVPPDIKKLIRALLKRVPAERASFDDFFGSTAMQKSKFPRPDALGEKEQKRSMGAVVVGGISQSSWSHDRYKAVPSEGLDPDAMVPPSKFNFRRASSGAVGETRNDADARRNVANGDQAVQGDISPAPTPVSRQTFGTVRQPSGISRTAPGAPAHQPPTSSRTSPPSPRHPSEVEVSVIPGETEEDGLLRREYVLVGDTRALEFNRAVDDDERALAPKDSAPIPDDGPSPEFMTERPPAGITTFPPAPSAGIPPPTPQLSSSPSRVAANALNRALSIASKKLFGTLPRSSPIAHSPLADGVLPSPQAGTPSSTTTGADSPRRPQLIGGADEERDPLEDALLGRLEELAQKTDVLTRWADEMYEYVKAVPQKPLPNPTKFEKRAGEAERQAWKRQRADAEAEYNAVTCVAVYMLLMSFSQKGVDELRRHQEHMLMRHPDGDYVVSEGFDDALAWFRDHFLKCHERATLVKSWLPARYDGPKTWLDQLVYDRALYLSRTAARKELLDQATTPDECEKLYEECLWCLYALQDDLLQSGNPFMDEDRETIATWIKRTKLRLLRCRARMAMDHHERLIDARADETLADVARIPAPWDAKTT